MIDNKLDISINIRISENDKKMLDFCVSVFGVSGSKIFRMGLERMYLESIKVVDIKNNINDIMFNDKNTDDYTIIPLKNIINEMNNNYKSIINNTRKNKSDINTNKSRLSEMESRIDALMASLIDITSIIDK